MNIHEPEEILDQDLEGNADDLDIDEPSAVKFWELKQRELITNVVDYNLGSLADLLTNKNINSDVRYQRRYRWDDARKSKLIESFLMNVPVPPIFLNEDSYGKYSVIDGKQRLNTVFQFLRGRLKLQSLEVFNELNGKSFDDLPTEFQDVIRTRPTLRAVIVLRQSDEDVKYEVFRRLNTGGVRLNPQEIRNSVFTGSLNNLILDISETTKFSKLLGIKEKAKSALFQEMRDCELILRYFAMRDSWRTYSGGMKRHLDTYMANNRHANQTQIDSLKTEFFETLDKVYLIFGDHAFQRWQPEKNAWRNQVLAALFDAEMLACREFDIQTIQSKKDKVIPIFQELFSDTNFRKVVDAATNTPSSFIARINIIHTMIKNLNP